MDLSNIMDLLERFEASSLSFFELELSGAHLKMKKGEEAAIPVSRENKEILPAKAIEPKKEESKQKELRTPLAGTFYCAPSPDEEPFVKVGQKIRKGDVIGIIEAMKLMNEVTASEDGIVEEIVAGNGELVAYDEVLIRYV